MGTCHLLQSGTKSLENKGKIAEKWSAPIHSATLLTYHITVVFYSYLLILLLVPTLPLTWAVSPFVSVQIHCAGLGDLPVLTPQSNSAKLRRTCTIPHKKKRHIFVLAGPLGFPVNVKPQDSNNTIQFALSKCYLIA